MTYIPSRSASEGQVNTQKPFSYTPLLNTHIIATHKSQILFLHLLVRGREWDFVISYFSPVYIILLSFFFPVLSPYLNLYLFLSITLLLNLSSLSLPFLSLSLSSLFFLFFLFFLLQASALLQTQNQQRVQLLYGFLADASIAFTDIFPLMYVHTHTSHTHSLRLFL